MRRRWILAGLAAGTVTLAGAATLAASSPAPGGAAGVVGDVAAQLGVPASTTQAAITQADLDRVAALQAAGRLTPTQAQAADARIQAGGWRWLGGHARASLQVTRAQVMRVTSAYLGLSAAQLRADLRGGQSLNSVAGAVSGKTAAGLQAAILAWAQLRLGAAVTAGRLTAVQEQDRLAALQERLPTLMARTWGQGAAPSGATPA